jgi:pilus assembly protein CpaB
MDGLMGAIVRSPILAHEPVTNAKLVRGGSGSFMSVVLSPGMRAIAIPISSGSAAAGFILPGDRVDIMQAMRSEGGDGGVQGGYVAQTLLQNIKVLAIDQSSAPPKNGGQAQLGQTATLEVRPQEAEILAIAKARGDMTLTLRSYADVNASTNNAGGKTVQIIRNGQATETMVRP